jgi:peroxiredoxin
MRLVPALILCAVAAFAADPGQRAPGFALMDSNGNVFDHQDYRGKPVVIEFMQTTCPHCAAFADVLNRVQAKYGDKIQILAIANPPDNPQTVAKFVQGHGVRYPVLFDSGQAAYSYMKKMKFDLPQVFLLDQKGIIFNHYENTALTSEIFQGNGLFGEIDRLLGTANPAAQKSGPAAAKKK